MVTSYTSSIRELFVCGICILSCISAYSCCETDSSLVDHCFNEFSDNKFIPHSPLIRCELLYPVLASKHGDQRWYCFLDDFDNGHCVSSCNFALFSRPIEFLTCAEPLDLKNNETAREVLGFGCTKFGGQRFEDVQFTSVNCSVLPDIECYGLRKFYKDGFPCIKYSGHYFGTTLLYSVLLGFLGMDRFCLGHTGTAVGKLLTLGGASIWWIVDIALLITGNLMPEDGSNWVPYA